VVRQGAKRRTAPDILTSDEVQELLANLRFREQTLVLVGRNHRLAEERVVRVEMERLDFQATDSCNTLDRAELYCVCKTKARRNLFSSRSGKALREWHRQKPYQSSESWVFASPVNQGRWPFLAQEIMLHHIIPVARKLGITKRIGLAYFSFIPIRPLLRSTGAELKIMQELLRHSTIRVTLDTYTRQSQRKSEMRRRQLSRSCSEKNAGDVSSAWKNSFPVPHYLSSYKPTELAG